MTDHTIERQLLEALLGWASGAGPEALLARVLDVTVRGLRAQRGYLAVFGPGEGLDQPPRWWSAVGFDSEDLTEVRAAVSDGVLREAVESGEVVLSSSALTDRRFSQRHSVQFLGIEAVLAARIGEAPRGLVYLQGPEEGAFDADDEALLARLVDWLEPVAARVSHSASPPTDPTAPYRLGGAFDDVVGRSRLLAEVLRQAAAFAEASAPVLLLGETGTGKNVMAKAIHAASARRDGPFVTVNAAAIPDTLLEAELFGAARGAFTGADAARKGKIAAAEGGTLFLDEVGDLSEAAQAKLLQFTQDGTYSMLGETREKWANVRLITATNADLRELVTMGRFREDLMHRLTRLPLRLPPLRDRIEDIPLLVETLGRRAARYNGLPWVGLSEEAAGWVVAQRWSGNIRQLENAIERALVLSRGRAPIGLEELRSGAGDAARVEGPEPEELVAPLPDAVRAFQRRRIEAALRSTGGNKTHAAERLGISRSRLYELCGQLGIA